MNNDWGISWSQFHRLVFGAAFTPCNLQLALLYQSSANVTLKMIYELRRPTARRPHEPLGIEIIGYIVSSTFCSTLKFNSRTWPLILMFGIIVYTNIFCYRFMNYLKGLSDLPVVIKNDIGSRYAVCPPWPSPEFLSLIQLSNHIQ